MKKKVWIWILSIIGILVVSTVGIFLIYGNVTNELGSDDVENAGILVQKISEQKLGESILVTGKVIPEEEQKVYLNPENGEVHEYFVEENQQVAAGDPLFTYDVTKINAEYNKAVRSRDLTQSRLKIEQNELAAMDKRLAEMKKKVKNGDEDYTAEDVNLLSKERVQSEMDIENTKDELTSAQELINELATTKKSMTVTSKINGTVVKVNKNIERAEDGAMIPVIHLISSEPYKVIGTMSEFDTVKIQPGQAVTIRPKVFKDREWNGVVESVSQFPDEEGGMDDFGGGGNVTMYPFKVAITDDTTELRQGFHVSLEINVSGAEKSLAIPHMALTVDEEGQEFVYVLADGLLEKRIVQLGEMNDEFIGVNEGVADGELVVIMPDESMHDGMEVTFYDEIDEY